jgi:ABC-type polysaccharide/polyol phosphate export permease
MTSLPSSEEWIENRSARGVRWPNLGELWQHRELAGFLALRDLKIRYKQAVFGAAWAVLEPLAGVVVFTVVFSRFADVPSQGIPYPVFALVGLTAWTYASTTVARTTASLVGNSPLVTKVYFPRLLAPVSALLPGLVDLLISLVVVAVFVAIYHIPPTWAIITLPMWICLMIVAVFAIGLWLGALYVVYRDINPAISLLITFWLFVSPVAYPSSIVPPFWRALYFVNPMAGVIEGMRWSILGAPWPGSIVFLSIPPTVLLLLGGIVYFEQTERRFADVI